VLHLSGFDHKHPTCRHTGIDYLTDVCGEVIPEIIS
jgi:hypothetical protein